MILLLEGDADGAEREARAAAGVTDDRAICAESLDKLLARARVGAARRRHGRALISDRSGPRSRAAASAGLILGCDVQNKVTPALVESRRDAGRPAAHGA